MKGFFSNTETQSVALHTTTYFDLRTETVFAYTVCCVHVASNSAQSKH